MAFDPSTTVSIDMLPTETIGSKLLPAGSYAVRTSNNILLSTDSALVEATPLFPGEEAQISLAAPTTVFVRSLNAGTKTTVGFSSTTAAPTGTTVELWETAETNGNEGQSRVRSLGSTGNFNFNLPRIPTNFVSLARVFLRGSPNAGAAGSGKSITLLSQYGPLGGLRTATSQSDTDVYDLGVEDEIVDIDVTVVFTTLGADFLGSLNVDHNGIGGSFEYRGVGVDIMV